MGHYDDAREAHEEREAQEASQRKGRKFREIVSERSDVELGKLMESYEGLVELAKAMNGNAGQHRALQSLTGRISDFFKRFRP